MKNKIIWSTSQWPPSRSPLQARKWPNSTVSSDSSVAVSAVTTVTPTYATKLESQELSAAISWSSRIPRSPDNSASPISKWMGYSLAPIGTMITHSGNGNVSSQTMPDQLKNHLVKLSSHTTPTTRTRPWSGSFGLLTFPKSSGSLDGQSLFH